MRRFLPLAREIRDPQVLMPALAIAAVIRQAEGDEGQAMALVGELAELVLNAEYAFFNFSKHYLIDHKVEKNFQVNDEVMTEFRHFLNDQQITYNENEMTEVQDWVKANIKSELFTSVFGQQDGLKARAEWDPMIKKAIELLPQAAQLQQHAIEAMNHKRAAVASAQ